MPHFILAFLALYPFQTGDLPPVTPAIDAVTPPTIIMLKRDTPLELMAMTEVSTANVKTGASFKLRVNRSVTVGSHVVIPVGAWAYGEVTSAVDAGGLGKSGALSARLTYLQLGDVRIALEGDVAAKGTGAGSAATAVLLSGWVGLFHRGNNAKIKAGETVAGFIAEDVTLDLSGPAPRRIDSAATKLTPQ